MPGTSWDYTEYYVLKDVPVVARGAVDTALRFLHDWSPLHAPGAFGTRFGSAASRWRKLRTRDGAPGRSPLSHAQALYKGHEVCRSATLIGYLRRLEELRHNKAARRVSTITCTVPDLPVDSYVIGDSRMPVEPRSRPFVSDIPVPTDAPVKGGSSLVAGNEEL